MNVHISSKLIAIGAGLGLIMLSPILAHAGCSQSDLAGTWYAYSMSADALGSFPPATIDCKVKINSSGSIVASKSSCNMRDYSDPVNSPVSGGNMKVTSGCNLSGTLKLDTPVGRQTLKIGRGTLSKDKVTLFAVGYVKEYPSSIAHLTAAKK